jgi:hypothetical protein
MKTIRQWGGSLAVVALFGAFVGLGASSALAQATKKGWWIRINTAKTTASAIAFQIGTTKLDSRTWRNWRSGQRVEFDVPTDFRKAAHLYLHATSNPHDTKAEFCVFYKNHGIEHFEFDGDEDHNMKQEDSDNECLP